MKNYRSIFLNGKNRIIALIALSLLAIGVVYFAYTTGLAALIALTILLVYATSTALQGPEPAEIAECAASFIERAANDLHEQLAVFSHLYYNVNTAEDGTRHWYPRWEWRQTNVSGLTVIQLGYLFTGQKRLSTEAL